MEKLIADKVAKWVNGNYDEATKTAIKELEASDPEALADAFYKDLEFGTGGLRGLMGVGTNRINRYTIGMATQGYANYLKQCFDGTISVAVAYDCRNNSSIFAKITADVFAANGIKVYLFESLRPTPALSFAIRYHKCKGGVVITASHNPKEYNGYKAYWDDGAQMVPPHDKNVIKEVEKIASVEDVLWSGKPENITMMGQEMDDAYLGMVKTLSVYPDVCVAQKDLKIVYTPIHGTGITLVPEALEKFGFTNVHIVEAQSTPSGDFPTVEYPNPEETETMAIGLAQAAALDADILLGTDPDADRLGVGVKNNKGEWVLLNGNQTAMLAFNYMIEARKAKGIARENDMVIKTIVTTNMIDEIAKQNNVACYNVLTGFKWISSMIAEKEGSEHYIIGGEESFGLMIGDKVRDKDAVSAVAMLCEMAAYEKAKGRSLFDKLVDLSITYGLYREALISITKKGRDGAAAIATMMEDHRSKTPVSLGGVAVKSLLDYDTQKGKNLSDGSTWEINLPKSNVLQFVLEDGSVISARPSGTEPKIKYYFSVNMPLASSEKYDESFAALGDSILRMQKDLNLIDS